MKFLVIGILCIIVGWNAKRNPEKIRNILNKYALEIEYAPYNHK